MTSVMSHRRPVALASVALLGAAAAPAAAQAAPVFATPLKPCYVTVDPSAREVINMRVSGFEPTADVDIAFDGSRMISFVANAAGVVKARLQAPFQPSGQRDLAVTLTERDNPALTVTATTRVTALAVTLSPKRAATSKRIRFRGRGFTRARSIWGHYVYRGRARKTVRFAKRPAGACGTFSVRRRQIPILRPRAGHWTLQVDQQHKWSSRPDSVFVPVPITVQRVIGG
jgi:hypothetical protein